ncbi:MAG: hypothetical protein ACXWLH_05265 [Candidatus Saccharimonadales bacterium]
MPAYINQFVTEAEQRLEETNFYQKSVADLELPPLMFVETPDGKPIFYQVLGNLAEAKSVVVEPMAYSTRLSDTEHQVRLAAKQSALGDEYCMVGVQYFDPEGSEFANRQKWQIFKGDYKPIADRVLAVIDALNLRDEQELILYGYSLGADISVEVAFQNLDNWNCGLRRIDRLGAVDFTRGQNRSIVGGLAVLLAFARSGGNLYENTVGSGSRALIEATGIDLADPAAEKKYLAKVNKHVTKYFMSDMTGNLAGFIGAATDGTVQHINDIGSYVNLRPLTKAGRTDDSLICKQSFLDCLQPHQDLVKFHEPGDHATADEIRRDVAFVLRTALS